MRQRVSTAFVFGNRVTTGAKGEEIGKGIGLTISLCPEDAERLDVVNVKSLANILLRLSATAAGVVVAVTRIPGLTAPVGTVIGQTTALPKSTRGPARAILAGLPSGVAGDRTENVIALEHFRGDTLECLAAPLARSLKSVLAAFLAAINTIATTCPGRWDGKQVAALDTDAFYLRLRLFGVLPWLRDCSRMVTVFPLTSTSLGAEVMRRLGNLTQLALKRLAAYLAGEQGRGLTRIGANGRAPRLSGGATLRTELPMATAIDSKLRTTRWASLRVVSPYVSASERTESLRSTREVGYGLAATFTDGGDHGVSLPSRLQ